MKRRPPAGEGFDLVQIGVGLYSIRSNTNHETFHPVIGPAAEAELLHVRQQRLVERARLARGPFVVWDVGLGAAANAIAALDALADADLRTPDSVDPAPVELISFELDLGAIEFALLHYGELSYLGRHAGTVRQLIEADRVRVGNVEWRLRRGNFRALIHSVALPAPDAILFDPYSPASNPELWSVEAFTDLFRSLSPEKPCLLTNYTRSTAIRVALLLAGFFVGRGWPIADKEETTVAANAFALVEAPLDRSWLDRTRRSTRSAPPRDAGAPAERISEEVWEELAAHRQWDLCGARR